MKSFLVASTFTGCTLLLAAPALAITANGGTVAAGARAIVDSITDADIVTDSAAGVPGTLSASAAASVQSGDNFITAATMIVSNWSSATQGSISMDWGWDARNIGSGAGLTMVDTRVPGNISWSYSFLTGAGGGSFEAAWTLLTTGNTLGLQGVYGGSGLPSFITPFTLEPVDAAGSFSVALNPNTSYNFRLFNFGNLSNDQLNNVGSVSFAMDWRIIDGNVAVPEPSSWAMLIAGFGLIGAARRRERRRAAA